MVPENHEEEIHERIGAWQKDHIDGGYAPSFAYFKIEKKAENYQLLEVGCTWHDDFENTGWYEADKNKFTPKRYLHYFWVVPANVLLMISLILAITIALWYLCRFGFRYAWKRIRGGES